MTHCVCIRPPLLLQAYISTRDPSVMSMRALPLGELPPNVASGSALVCTECWGEPLMLIKVKVVVRGVRGAQVEKMVRDVTRRTEWVSLAQLHAMTPHDYVASRGHVVHCPLCRMPILRVARYIVYTGAPFTGPPLHRLFCAGACDHLGLPRDASGGRCHPSAGQDPQRRGHRPDVAPVHDHVRLKPVAPALDARSFKPPQSHLP